MELSIVIPTVTGREHHLDRCLTSYAATVGAVEFIVIKDEASCSVAWNKGIEKATQEFIHLTADDLEVHPGSIEAGLRVVRDGMLPEARILNPDGSLFSCGADGTERPSGEGAYFSRIPIFHRSLLDHVYPIFHGHYYGDVWISEEARRHGIETVIERDYLFTHHWASEGRKDTLDADWKLYQRFLKRRERHWRPAASPSPG